MREELDFAFSEIAQDKNIRVVIVQGAGKSFSAGADIGQFLTGEIGSSAAFPLITRHLTNTIETCPQVVIFKLHGYVLGGGLEIALSGDLRVASEDAELGLPELNLGMIPGSGGTQRLPRIVGVPKAKEMLFLGKRLSAQEAYGIGLVHQVVPQAKLDETVNEMVEEVLKKAPIALAAAKTALNKVWNYNDLESGLAMERELVNICSETKDRHEGLLAFKEKRPANFKGE